MSIIYLDNYRGFHKSFIPLKKVNFLVGENSTGKSSLLAVFKFIAKPDFIMYPEFNDDDIELGFYKDISNPRKKKYFDVGSISGRLQKGSLKDVEVNMIRFVEVASKPKLSIYRFIVNEVDIMINFHSDKLLKVTYRKLLKKQHNRHLNDRYEFFKNWLEDFQFEGKKITIKLASKPAGLPVMYYAIMEIMIELKLQEGRGITLSTPFSHKFTWVAPIRAKPKRIYEQFKDKHTAEGEHSPIVLKRMFDKPGSTLVEANEFINKFGKESGLYSRIGTRALGPDVTAPFVVEIEIKNRKHNIANVGYGVSQILPLITELVTAVEHEWIAIQQPEVHLHPKAQAAFGDIILMSYLNKKINFLIETHSEYTVDRFRMSYSKEKIKSEDAQVLFFKKTISGNQVYPITIGKDGRYVGSLPKEFKDFFINEELRLLDL